MTTFSPINYDHYADEAEEAEAIASKIKTLREAGVPGAGIAVLVRTNRQTRALETAFIHAGFTFRIIGAYSFWNRYQIAAITSYLKVLVSPQMPEWAATVADKYGNTNGSNALATAIGTPARFIGAATCRKAAVVRPSDPLTGLSGVKVYDKQKQTRDGFIKSMLALREKVGTMPVIDLIREVADTMGVSEWLRDQDGGDDETPETNGSGALAFLDDVAVAGAEWGDDLLGFVKWIVEQEGVTGKPADLRDANTDDAVTVLSIHRSKGLEWPVVFVAGMSEGLMPHALAATDREVEEERRMAYVALTRAEDVLFVSSSSLYAGKPAGVSEFVVQAGLIAEDEVEVVEF